MYVESTARLLTNCFVPTSPESDPHLLTYRALVTATGKDFRRDENC